MRDARIIEIERARVVVGEVDFSGSDWNRAISNEAGAGEAVSQRLPIVVNAAPNKIEEEIECSEDPEHRSQCQSQQRRALTLQVHQAAASQPITKRSQWRSLASNYVRPGCEDDARSKENWRPAADYDPCEEQAKK